jgi:hypothetical protein
MLLASGSANAADAGKDIVDVSSIAGFAALAADSVAVVRPGHYHGTSSVIVSAENVTIVAFGAVFDVTIEVAAKGVRLYGATVRGAQGDGFRFRRGQGSHFEALVSEGNGGNGFTLGGEDGAQVAWSSFQACRAIRNAKHGWSLDAQGERTWINANTFDSCWSRSNGGAGWHSAGRVNYNSWFGHHVESNGRSGSGIAAMDLDGAQNFLYGGHVVATPKDGVAFRCAPGRDSVIFGGRYVGSVAGARIA